MEELQVITVSPREVPVCPECGASSWIVHDKVQRSSRLLRVDGLGDIVRQKADIGNVVQTVLLQCENCLLEYHPDSSLNSREENTNTQAQQVEAYNDDTKVLYDFPSSITNESSWR